MPQKQKCPPALARRVLPVKPAQPPAGARDSSAAFLMVKRAANQKKTRPFTLLLQFPPFLIYL